MLISKSKLFLLIIIFVSALCCANENNQVELEQQLLSAISRNEVPKSLTTLKLQTAGRFLTARRGIFLLAADVSEKQFSYIVDGVLPCVQTSLEKSFFAQRPAQPVTIYIFQNNASYKAGLREFLAMEPISPYGHYGHSKRYIVINYQTGPGTLVHELVHSLMAADFPNAPIWIAEGIASLYEQCRVENDRLIGEQNWRLPELQRAIRANEITPLKKLFVSDTKNFRLMRESLHYAQCRYFCLYLQEQGVLEKIYHEFRQAEKEDRFGIATVEKIFGKSLNEIETDWLTWCAEQQWEKTNER